MFSNMLVAEERLLEACKKGEMLFLGNKRPTEKTADNEIRGEFLRTLILSNNQEILEKDGTQYILKINSWGINIIGAYISGIFDFSYCETNISYKFLDSIFENKIDLMYSKIDSLYFSGTKTKSINGHGLLCINNIFFDNCEIEGELNFGFSEIRNLGFSNGSILNKNKNALSCISAIIKDNISLSKIKIHGNLILSLSKINNLLNLSNLYLIGNIEFESTKTNIVNIEGNKFWENKEFDYVKLLGLEYNHLTGNLDSKILINLLEKMPEFKPQPYRQLVKVLRNNGDNIYADDVMIKYNDIQVSKNTFILKILKKIYKITTGYGYRPKNMLGTLIIVWLICGWFYQKTAEIAVFAPNNPLIFQKKDFYQCVIDENGTSFSDLCNQKEYNEQNNWTKSKKLEGEYTTFQPYIYSLDLILPVVDLQMNKDWGIFISPTNSDFTLNDLTRWIVWIEIIIGWTLGYILLSYFSGIISKRD